jgi:hypothetical protein
MKSGKEELKSVEAIQPETRGEDSIDSVVVPSVTLRADNPVHFALLGIGLDKLRERLGRTAPAATELETTLREWEVFCRELGGFNHATALSGTPHFR